MIWARLIASGRVQGVFYRACIRNIARERNITGYVRNMSNGDVEIICECKNEKQFEEFCRAADVKSGEPYVNSIHIADKKYIEKPVYSEFNIKY